MASVKEQVEAFAAVDDSLKGTENPMAGEWEGAGATNTGQKTSTGWTLTAEKTSAAAKRKAAFNCAAGAIVKVTIDVLQAVGQIIEEQFGVTGEAQKVGVYVERTATAKAEVGLFDKTTGVLGKLTEVALAAGDTFYLSWEPTTGKLTAWKKTGGVVSEVLNKTAEAPISSVKPAIFFAPEGVAGTAGRVTNYGALALSAATPPRPGSLALMGVGR